MPRRKGSRLYDTDTINLAIKEVEEKKLTIRRAALKYCIPKSTLSDYVKNKRIKLEVEETPYMKQQILSNYEESILVKWIIDQAQNGILVTKKSLREEAHKMVIENPQRSSKVCKERSPGAKWTSLFIARHPEIQNIILSHKGSSSATSLFQNFNSAEAEMIEVEADLPLMLNDNMEEHINEPHVYNNVNVKLIDRDARELQMKGKYNQKQSKEDKSEFIKSQESASYGNAILHKKLRYKNDCNQQASNASDLNANENQRTRTAGLQIKLTAPRLSYTCSNCKLKFESKTKRDFHVFYRHNFGVQLKCNLCECVFKKKGKLNIHMKTCYLSCADCTFICRDKISLHYHIMVEHIK